MAASRFRLNCSIAIHEKDVRTVAATIFPDNGIVSGSRDVTTRLWSPKEGSNGFVECQCLRGHSNFVCSVCVSPPSTDHPYGVIYTGSNDSTINAYCPMSGKLIVKLSGHSSTVSTLVAGKCDTLVSGSWDKTAKVWCDMKCVATLQGHTLAVWAVALLPQEDQILTGSADKSIKLWASGKVLHTFTGHTDCIRGLVVFSTTDFLSCSNDATIKHWTIKGQCLRTLYGHTNYIYGIAILADGESFVSCGEDRTIKVWKSGECFQTIPHPAESVWAVCGLPNGDIVSGSSDGVIRVFTCDPSRFASELEQAALTDLVSASQVPTQIGDIDVKDLPGPESLTQPGKRDGQTKMVRDGAMVNLYQWDMAESKWMKMGEVIGGSGGSQSKSGKQLYEGKEYDYVFDVELQEGQPPLKLPYNIADNPWQAAKTFLDKNELSQLFLDQVANFIQKNTQGITLGQGQPTVSDPLTGGNRYMPGTDDTFTNQNTADPFTGDSRYQTTNEHLGNKYFPQQEFVKFTSVNIKSVIQKLKEFNNSLDSKLDESTFDCLEPLLNGSDITEDHLLLLTQLTQWPDDKLFPVLDVLRMCVCYDSGNKYVYTHGASIITSMLRFTQLHASVANKLLLLRLLANSFSYQPGVEWLIKSSEDLLNRITNTISGSNKNIQIAAVTVVLNYCVYSCMKGKEQLKIDCLQAVMKCFRCKDMDDEAVFRLLVALGTLLWNDRLLIASASSLDVKDILVSMQSATQTSKVNECSQIILNFL